MKGWGIIFIIAAIVLSLFAGNTRNTARQSESLAQGASAPYRAQGLQDAAREYQTMWISFGLAGVLFLAGVVMMASSKPADMPAEILMQTTKSDTSVENKLVQLLEMKNKGLITDEEFGQRKAQLLDSLTKVKEV